MTNQNEENNYYTTGSVPADLSSVTEFLNPTWKFLHFCHTVKTGLKTFTEVCSYLLHFLWIPPYICLKQFYNFFHGQNLKEDETTENPVTHNACLELQDVTL